MAQKNNSEGSTSNRWMVLAGATVAIAAAGYFAYGYYTNWSGPAYSLFGSTPTIRRNKKVKSPFCSQVDYHL